MDPRLFCDVCNSSDHLDQGQGEGYCCGCQSQIVFSMSFEDAPPTIRAADGRLVLFLREADIKEYFFERARKHGLVWHKEPGDGAYLHMDRVRVGEYEGVVFVGRES